MSTLGESRLIQRDRKARPPKMFHVVLLNDDFTPMDFVELLLQRVFAHSAKDAAIVTRRIHSEGRGICGTYTRDIAMTKAAQVETLAKRHDHPLRCMVEPDGK